MKIPLHRQSALQLAALIANGEAAPETVTRSFIEAIQERERDVQAFAWFDVERAIAAARELNLVSRRGPLHGLPFVVKDNIDTADVPTSYGSPIYEGHSPSSDAGCVALLKDAGAFVLGKTVLTEFANFTPGPTRNPHDLLHTPGGSSSGSAAAVAAHFAPIALGTQTAGSVIRPAAFCGVAAYKPSPQLIPRSGVKLNADTLDEVGVFARDIDDLAFIASVLTLKPLWKDLPEQGRTGAAPAVAVVPTSQSHLASPRALAALETVSNLAARQGARRIEATWPRIFDGLFEAQRMVQLFETARALAPEYTYRRARLSLRMVETLESGRAIATHDYGAALQLGRACAAALASLFGDADVLITLSAPGEAPAGLMSTGEPVFNRPWQLLGCPVVHLPLPRNIAHGESGLPLGVSLVARPAQDAYLLAAAAWIEAAVQASALQ